MKTDVRGGEGCQHSDSTPTLPTTLHDQASARRRASLHPLLVVESRAVVGVRSRICARDHEVLDIVPSAIENQEEGQGPGPTWTLSYSRYVIATINFWWVLGGWWTSCPSADSTHMGKETRFLGWRKTLFRPRRDSMGDFWEKVLWDPQTTNFHLRRDALTKNLSCFFHTNWTSQSLHNFFTSLPKARFYRNLNALSRNQQYCFMSLVTEKAQLYESGYAFHY